MTLDISQYAMESAASVFAVYVLVTFLKVPLGYIVSPDSPLYTWAVRALAYVVGVAILLGASAILHPLVPQSVAQALIGGIMTALSAIGTYHITSAQTDDQADGLGMAQTTPPEDAQSTAPSAQDAAETIASLVSDAVVKALPKPVPGTITPHVTINPGAVSGPPEPVLSIAVPSSTDTGSANAEQLTVFAGKVIPAPQPPVAITQIATTGSATPVVDPVAHPPLGVGG